MPKSVSQTPFYLFVRVRRPLLQSILRATLPPHCIANIIGTSIAPVCPSHPTAGPGFAFGIGRAGPTSHRFSGAVPSILNGTTPHYSQLSVLRFQDSMLADKLHARRPAVHVRAVPELYTSPQRAVWAPTILGHVAFRARSGCCSFIPGIDMGAV